MAIGWRSGELTVFNMAEPELYEQSTIHKKQIVFLVWNLTGRRLITGDKVLALVNNISLLTLVRKLSTHTTHIQAECVYKHIVPSIKPYI